MTHTRPITAATGPFARQRHALTAVTLAALALTGCGSELSGRGAQGEPAGAVVSAAIPAQPSTEQAAFEAMLDSYARDCPPADGTPLVPATEKPTGPVPTMSLAPGETPPADPIEPGPVTGPAAELSARDWCTGNHHQQRTIEALLKVPAPTPAKVRTTLNRLGYTDEHIHGLSQDGTTTRFHLDLRENGGQLCLTGAAAGETTDATMCVASATGPFSVTTEEQP